MNYLSVCSGIEAATVAWHPLGFAPAAFSEIEPFPCAALAHHYPGVDNFGDMEAHADWRISNVDLLVGGTPCQSFSVAGLRKGMADPRGNLALVYLAIADQLSPEWLVWENVPGVLSSNGGRDFGAFLGGLVELGYGWAYRVLDAQYFGVPQRRRRVFVVGCARGWQRAAAVLFEFASLRGDSAPSRTSGARIAGALNVGASDGGGWRVGADEAAAEQIVAAPLTASYAKHHGASGGKDCFPHNMIAAPLTAGSAPNSNAPGRRKEDDVNLVACFDETQTVDTTQPPSVSQPGVAVRRLTPRECERLQGFPDDYTLIPFRGRPASDTARYRALGNSMAVPVMRWIGERIAAIN